MEKPHEFNFAFYEPLPQIPLTEEYKYILGACNKWSQVLRTKSNDADYSDMRASLAFYAFAILKLREYEAKSLNELKLKLSTDLD